MSIDWGNLKEAPSAQAQADAQSNTQQPSPAQQAYATQLANIENEYGLGSIGNAQAEDQYAQDIIAMQQAGRSDPGGNIVMPPGVSGNDFMTLLSTMDNFASSAGYQYYPTASQINSLLRQGASQWNQQQVFQWLGNAEGVSSKMPWASAGMTHTQYDNAQTSLQDTMAQYTGDPNMYGELVSEALQKFGSNSGEAGTWITSQLLNNKKYSENAKTPWLQFGDTYQSWKQYKLQNKQTAVGIYNASGNVTDAQYAQMRAAGYQSRSAETGGAFNMGQQSQPSSLVTSAARSSAR